MQLPCQPGIYLCMSALFSAWHCVTGGYRYPNIACDLITSDVNEITETLVTTESLLNSIYTFLESDADLNPLQASFFSKVMGLLITRRSQMVRLLLLHTLSLAQNVDVLLGFKMPRIRNIRV